MMSQGIAADPALTAGSSGPNEKPTNFRWIICGLLFYATTVNYVDRSILNALEPTLKGIFKWTPSQYGLINAGFSLAYGIGFILMGNIIDKVGTRIGYAISITVWTLAALSTAFTGSVLQFGLARFCLGLGEAGNFPAAIKTVAEWFPQKQRATAIGIFNAGSNVGAIVTPLVVPIIAVTFGWRWAFVATGALTALWIVAWLGFYRRPREHPRVTTEELAWIESEPMEAQRPVKWRTLLRLRQTWAYMAGRFLIDPVWWTFLFWLPDFFNRQYHVKMLDFGPPLVAVYILADVGSVAGGWFSSRLLGRGMSVNRARKTAMFVCALFALPITVAGHVPGMWWAVLLIGLACACHQGFSANVYALPGDLFPRGMAGSVIGLGGLSGAIGGMLMAKFAGVILETLGSYEPIFAVAACAYLVALGVVHLLVPNYTPVEPEQLA
jgi:ACS family hexuronate transporter-like MFS transporter